MDRNLDDLDLAGAGNGTYSSYAYDFAIARLNADGTQDTTFGGGANDGVVLTDFGDEGGDLATSIVLLSGDKLLVAGGTDQYDQSAPDWAVAEYNADGTPDTLFGSSGVETINMGENYGDTITAAALSGTSGAFYVVGQTGDDDLTLLARNADGSADTLFGSGGEAEASFGGSSLSNAVARAVTVDASGNIVVAGTLTASGRPEVALARFTSAGALDGSFGFGGKFTDTVSTVAYVNSLAMTSAGYLVVGGMAPSNHFMVSEYDPADTVSTASTSLSYTVVQRFVYTPYGEATVLNADWSPSTATFGEDVNGWVYGFQGMRIDAVSGDAEADERSLNVRTGTWNRPDPTGYPDGPDRYGFEKNNPIAHLDPLGLRTVDIYIFLDPAGAPNNVDPAKIEANLNAMLAPTKAMVTGGNTFTIHVSFRASKPTPASERLGWQYDRPGGSYNASNWDCVPIVQWFTTIYRACAKKKTEWIGWAVDVPSGPPGYTGGAMTQLNYTVLQQQTLAAAGNQAVDWNVAYANFIAHEQLHLGINDSHDYGPAGDITSGTPFWDICTIPAAWSKSFISHLGL